MDELPTVVARALRFLAGHGWELWTPEELRAVADRIDAEVAEGESWSCPVCQEVECDDGCPLRPWREEVNR